MQRASAIVIFTAFAALIATSAQTVAKPTVWVDPANEYGNYLEAAVLKKQTPVTFTTNKADAQYVANLEASERKGSAVRAVFLGVENSGAKSNLSLTISDSKTGAVVFAYTCQKNGEGGSFQSASECLAKHWKNFVEKGKP